MRRPAPRAYPTQPCGRGASPEIVRSAYSSMGRHRRRQLISAPAAGRTRGVRPPRRSRPGWGHGCVDGLAAIRGSMCGRIPRQMKNTPPIDDVERVRPALLTVQGWTQVRLRSSELAPWEWFELMKLNEAVCSILDSGQAINHPTESSPQSARPPDAVRPPGESTCPPSTSPLHLVATPERMPT